MPNERLRAALLESGLTPYTLGDELGVDHKTVERWIAGRIPYRRHRYVVATRLGVDESYLWPGALARGPGHLRVTRARSSTIYPHRWDAPRETWARLFASAEQEIGVLVYAACSWPRTPESRRSSSTRPAPGCGCACCSAIPDSPEVAQRGRTKASMTPSRRRSATRW